MVAGYGLGDDKLDRYDGGADADEKIAAFTLDSRGDLIATGTTRAPAGETAWLTVKYQLVPEH